MGDFVTQYRLDLRARHAAQQAAAHGHQGRIAPRAGGKGIHFLGVENADFRHADLGLLSQTFDRADEPAFQIRLRGRDHAHPHHALGGPLGQRQRNQRAAETENRRKHQQTAQCRPAPSARRKPALDDEQHHAEQGQDRQVREDEQENAFHGAFLREKEPQYGNAAYRRSGRCCSISSSEFDGAARAGSDSTTRRPRLA